MKYKTEIIEAFRVCGYVPREGQIEYCQQVLEAYLDEGYKTVILGAPTGTGKSLLGAVIAEVLHQKQGVGPLSSFLLNGTNVLAQQYDDTFCKKKEGSTDFTFLKGANNYQCTALSGEEYISAEACSLSAFQNNSMDEIVDEHCKNCEFQRIKRRKNEAKNLITNYSYYFIDRMYLADTPAAMEKRTLAVFDEAHTINDLFVEHNAIYFSEKRLKSYHEEAADALRLGNTEVFKNIKTIQSDLVAGKITDQNYMQYLKLLHGVYKAISAQAEKEAEQNVKNVSLYNKLIRISKKYFGLGCKIDDLIIYQYDHIFEYKKFEQEVSVKAIFVSDMFDKLINSEYMLFMSATITPQFLIDTLGLKKEEVKFVQLAPSFPKESKKVVFYSPMQLNYTTLKEEKTITMLQNRVKNIVKKHSSEGEKGIVLTPSFDLTRQICDVLVWENNKYEVFEHKRGEKLEVILNEFKKYKKGPAVLVSPSLFEGISLDGDISRYQVFVKAPYPSLGDKRMKHILDNHQSIYEFITLVKVIQGMGRSTRSAEDHSVTYCLDQSLQRLWKSPQNIWTNEFSVNFTSMI